MLLRGTLFTLTMATSGPQLPTHHPSPPSSTHCRPKSPLWRLHTGSQADGMAQPAVWLDARECLALCESGQQRADTQESHTLIRGPKVSQQTRTVTAAVMSCAG